MPVSDHQHYFPISNKERDWQCLTTLPAMMTCKNFHKAEMSAYQGGDINFQLICNALNKHSLCIRVQVLYDALVLGDGAR